MSGEYVITFHTHYDAMVCLRMLEKDAAAHAGAISVKLIPVPRELSSSCGTAVKVGITNEEAFDARCLIGLEHDEIFTVTPDGKYCSAAL